MNVEMNELISELIELNDRISELSSELENEKAKRASLKLQLIDTFKNCGLDGASAEGKSINIVKKRQYSLLDVEGFLSLDDIYHTSVLPSINSNKLNSFLRDLEDLNGGELPEDIARTVRGYEYEDLSIRKIK